MYKAQSLKCLALFVVMPMFIAAHRVSAQDTNNQGRGPENATVEKGVVRRHVIKGRSSPVQVVARPDPTPQLTITLVNKPEPEYLSGEANVTVRGNQNPIVRLGLAQNGVTIVEFPAADKIYYLHPGNSELVTVDDMKNKETDQRENRFLVFRPGAAFVAPRPGSSSRSPSASIMAQMQSGMVITFLIYPVRELSENAHRCVVMYNREEIIAARRAAGLAVNLDGEPTTPARTTAVSIKITNSSTPARNGESGDQNNGSSHAVEDALAPVVSDVDSSDADSRAGRGKSKKHEAKPAEAANKALRDAVKSPAKFLNWSAPTRGFSICLTPAVDLDQKTRLVVVAARNNSQETLRLIPNNPEIHVQTFDDSGKPVAIEQIKRLHVEATALAGLLAPGQVAYWAIVYEAPILGARQRVRVSVAQPEAADKPVELRAGTR
jgi:hypothetical protein